MNIDKFLSHNWKLVQLNFFLYIISARAMCLFLSIPTTTNTADVNMHTLYMYMLMNECNITPFCGFSNHSPCINCYPP